MVITVDILKKINRLIASGNYPTLGQVAAECSLDKKMLTHVCGDLGRTVPSMIFFFNAMESYLEETAKRLKMMSECYRAIQKMQIENGFIKPQDKPDVTPIIW
ncbi:MAG: hypothetical protein LBO21_05805 [Synergistaceae bacterium]|jgi:hypothetical protein|nr:hypothetical protein [Synergistaceae bacterium]